MMTIVYLRDWRDERWDDEVPSRPGWRVTCAVCGLIGSPPGLPYAWSHVAEGVSARHERSDKHAREVAVRYAH